MPYVVGTVTQNQLDQLEQDLRDAENRAYNAEQRLSSRWYDTATGWDAIPLVLFSILAMASVLIYMWSITGENFWSIGLHKGFSLVMGPLVGIAVMSVGFVLNRLLNGYWAEWIGGLTIVLGTAIFVIMVTAIPSSISTATISENPTIEVNRAPTDWDEVKVTGLKLPTTFQNVIVLVQTEKKLPAAEAKAISDTTPLTVQVPKGNRGKVFFKVDERPASLASSY